MTVNTILLVESVRSVNLSTLIVPGVVQLRIRPMSANLVTVIFTPGDADSTWNCSGSLEEFLVVYVTSVDTTLQADIVTIVKRATTETRRIQ